MTRGYTLIEVIIAIGLLSMCVIGFIEALSVGMLGTDRVRQTNFAVELTRSQMEHIQQQDFIPHDDSEPSQYGNVSELPPGWNISDVVTTIYNVTDANGSLVDNRVLQEVVVNVTYSGGKTIELRDYKSPRQASFVTSGSGWLISSVIDVPTLPEVFAWTLFCSSPPPYWGYYYTFETGTTTSVDGPISIMWIFNEGGSSFWNNINIADLYLYNYDTVDDIFQGERGLTQTVPPSGWLEKQSSWWGADREMCAIEQTSMPPGKYTAYFYNPGICLILVYYGRSIPPSMGTITYYK